MREARCGGGRIGSRVSLHLSRLRLLPNVTAAPGTSSGSGRRLADSGYAGSLARTRGLAASLKRGSQAIYSPEWHSRETVRVAAMRLCAAPDRGRNVNGQDR